MVEWLERAPEGTMLSARAVADRIRELELDDAVEDPEPVAPAAGADVEATPEPTWQTRLWLVPAETRLSAAEVCEAVGRSKDWLYRRTGTKADHRIPHRRLDGVLVFVAGEVREWIREHEEQVQDGPTDAPAKHLHLARG